MGRPAGMTGITQDQAVDGAPDRPVDHAADVVVDLTDGVSNVIDLDDRTWRPRMLSLRHPDGDLACLDVLPSADLTEVELVVLEAMSWGLTNAQIAAALGMSPHTVKTHVRHVTDKLGAVNRTDAARMFVRARSA